MTLSIAFTPKEQQQSLYDWADLSCGNERVGKARCTLSDSTIIIYSINIYPAWEGLGYGREFVDYCKSHFPVVIADRVRHSATGFWSAMGFSNDNDGNWSYRRSTPERERQSR